MNVKPTLAFFMASLVLTLAAAQDKPKEGSTYEALVEKVKGGDKTVDFKQLRLAYADSPTSRPDTDPQKKAMIVSVNSKRYAEALKNADVVLASDFVDMDAHFVEYIAQRELKNDDQAAFHKFVLQALLDSITHSGDGKTPDTAFQVIEVHEEYVLLRFMGLMPSKQSLSEQNGHSYDVMEAVNPKTNEKVTLYFNIDIEEKRLKDALK